MKCLYLGTKIKQYKKERDLGQWSMAYCELIKNKPGDRLLEYPMQTQARSCLLYTSDAADEERLV